MELIMHRVNSISSLRNTPSKFGCEIDLRTYGQDLILNHEPLATGDLFLRFLDEYARSPRGTLIINIKTAGIETMALREAEARGIRSLFLLDVEFPYLYQATRKGERRIAVRYSEDEPLANAELYRDRVDWAWIDTNSRLPLDGEVIRALAPLKICLVCPGRWGRPQDIAPYRRQMEELDFTPDAVMTDPDHIDQWVK